MRWTAVSSPLMFLSMFSTREMVLRLRDDVGLAFDPTVLPDHGVVVDLVYHPADTPLLAGARAAGRPAVGGLGMLVHQAARAFSSWTGVDAPLDAMRAAARPEPR